MYVKGLLKLCVPVVGVWLFASCTDSFLGVTQTNNLDQTVVFSDSTYTSQFLNQIYADIGFDVNPNRYTVGTNPHGGLQTASDEAAYMANTGGATDIYFVMGNITPMTTAEDDVWRRAYRNIRRVNVFFQNVDGCPMDEDRKNTYKAEARFLRAWYYAMLLRHYGGFPIVYDDVYNSVEEGQKARDQFDTCVEYICSEAEAAAEELPATQSGTYEGRATKGACYGLISRVRLYAASPLFNGGLSLPADYPTGIVGYPDADQERWKTAVDAALDVIKMGQYSLYYRDTDQNNNSFPGWGWYAALTPADWYTSVGTDVYSGHIFEWKRQTNGAIEHQQLFLPPSMGANGNGGYLYHDLVAAYPMRDGKYGKDAAGNDQLAGVYIDSQSASDLEAAGVSQYTFDPLLKTELDPAAPDLEKPDLTTRDPRLQFMVIYDGCYMRRAGVISTINTYIGGGQDAINQGTPTGYYVRKFTRLTSSAQFGEGGSQSRALIRYAEILLNYAEAANEYYGPAHTDNIGGEVLSPVRALREIRRCAGIEAGDDESYGIPDNLTQEQLRALIRMERRLELAFEGHRFFDVRRWMVYGDQNANTTWWMHGMEVTRANDGTKSGRVFETRQYTFRKAMYLYPIPYKETVKSPDLIQNPYYE